MMIGCDNGGKKSRDKETGKEIIVQQINTDALINTDSIISDFKVIPLQNTNPPIGNIKKLMFCKGKIIIWDQKGKSIWVFSEEGNFISSISSLGRGPKEYTSINNVSITTPNIINIADAASKSIIKYNFEGKFIERFSTISYLSDYIEKDGYKYSFYHDIVSEDINKYFLKISDNSGFRSGFFPFTCTRQFGENYFIKSNEDIYFNKSFDNRIYKISGDKLMTAYTLNFGIDTFPCHKLENLKENDNYYKIINSKKFIGNMSNICLTKNFLTFFYEIRDKKNPIVMFFIYNLRTDKYYNYQYAKTEKYVIATNPKFTDGEYFYDTVEPWTLSKISRSKLFKKFNVSVTADSNPILLKFKYK